jgi:rieske iron-sulfur protein
MWITIARHYQLLSRGCETRKLGKISDRIGRPLVRFVRRREILKSALGMGLGLRAVDWAAAQETDPGVDAPQENDLFAFAEGDREGEIIAPGDVPLGGPPVAAFPLDTKSGRVRNRSRLNRVVLIRLAPQEIEENTRIHSAEGIVAYSAVCTHTACDISEWIADAKHLLCPCHGSKFDVKDGARVMNGPAPRRLAMLPVKVYESKLMVAGSFTGRVGSPK